MSAHLDRPARMQDVDRELSGVHHQAAAAHGDRKGWRNRDSALSSLGSRPRHRCADRIEAGSSGHGEDEGLSGGHTATAVLSERLGRRSDRHSVVVDVENMKPRPATVVGQERATRRGHLDPELPCPAGGGQCPAPLGGSGHTRVRAMVSRPSPTTRCGSAAHHGDQHEAGDNKGAAAAASGRSRCPMPQPRARCSPGGNKAGQGHPQRVVPPLRSSRGRFDHASAARRSAVAGAPGCPATGHHRHGPVCLQMRRGVAMQPILSRWPTRPGSLDQARIGVRRTVLGQLTSPRTGCDTQCSELETRVLRPASDIPEGPGPSRTRGGISSPGSRSRRSPGGRAG